MSYLLHYYNYYNTTVLQKWWPSGQSGNKRHQTRDQWSVSGGPVGKRSIKKKHSVKRVRLCFICIKPYYL